MAELADVPDLGSGAYGVQVRPLLSAPRTQCNPLGPFFIVFNRVRFSKKSDAEVRNKMRRKINLNYTVEQAAAEFYRHSEIKGLAEATIKAYKNYVNNFMDWFGADMPAEEITTSVIEEYTMYKKEQGIKPVSVATYVRHVRCFVRFCEKRGIMKKVEITLPKYEKELKEPYTDEEMALLLIRPKGDSWVEYRCWAMVNYFFATGQRLSTVINIKVKDVDLINKQVFLAWNKDKIQKYMPLSTQICRVLTIYYST